MSINDKFIVSRYAFFLYGVCDFLSGTIIFLQLCPLICKFICCSVFRCYCRISICFQNAISIQFKSWSLVIGFRTVYPCLACGHFSIKIIIFRSVYNLYRSFLFIYQQVNLTVITCSVTVNKSRFRLMTRLRNGIMTIRKVFYDFFLSCI